MGHGYLWTHLYGTGRGQGLLPTLVGDRIQPHQREDVRDGGTRHEPVPHHHQVVRGPAGHNATVSGNGSSRVLDCTTGRRRNGLDDQQLLSPDPLGPSLSAPGEGHACRRLELDGHREQLLFADEVGRHVGVHLQLSDRGTHVGGQHDESIVSDAHVAFLSRGP